MGMGIYSSNSTIKEYTLKNPDGSVCGTFRIKKSAKKKPKRLSYNFKLISSQILMAKTSSNAGKVVLSASMTVGRLQKKLRSGVFDDKEVELAILHAKRMERIARKRLKHLKEEENAEKQGIFHNDITENDSSVQKKNQKGSGQETAEDELQKLTEELEKLMKEVAKRNETAANSTDALSEIVQRDLEPTELERLKKKHRAGEIMAIAEADRKYLIALFSKLQKERENAASGGHHDCESVSLELSGTEMPVTTTEIPITATGESIDLSI
ncbi:MAG: hypothetical protein NC300_03930 [Bacteroidales bacterium]|nr:hypothetical protein [Clostridium sp.]MCM1203270.1 hypothetical protein [Bacteroidales bacterium]